MKKNNIFISLPSLKRIEVTDYMLFKKSWNYQLQGGLNLFVGANGLGKTTTANLVIYGMVGETKNIKEKYFESRKGGVTDDSLISLAFSVKNINFEITRKIKGSEILKLKVDGSNIQDSKYIEVLLNAMDISTIDDLTFLLESFLIREEEGNYLLWDFEAQHRLLKLLMNSKKFNEEYNKYAQKLLKTENEYKKVSEQERKIANTRIENLKKEKQRELEKRKTSADVNILTAKLQSINNSKEELDRKKKDVQEELEYLINITAKWQGEIFEFEDQLEQIKFQDKKLQNNLFKHVYSDEQLQHVVHKLKYYNSCIFCKNTISAAKSNEIVNRIELKCKCPVCETKLKNDGTEEVVNSNEIIEIINKNKINVQKIKAKLEKSNKDLALNNERIKVLQNDYQNVSRELSRKNIELIDTENELRSSQNSEFNYSKFDSLIEDAEDELKVIDNKITPLTKKINEHKEKLEEKIQVQTKIQNSFMKELNEIFENYAQRYFYGDCFLSIESSTGKVGKLLISYFIPDFDRQPRKSIKSCSTSQRTILEYLFRVSLLELYSKLSGFSSFFILESSEGQFDLTGTKQLASTINSFTESKHINCIVIANFSKVEFLSALSIGIDKSAARFKNFLEFSELNSFQKGDKDKYDAIISNLNLI